MKPLTVSIGRRLYRVPLKTHIQLDETFTLCGNTGVPCVFPADVKRNNLTDPTFCKTCVRIFRSGP